MPVYEYRCNACGNDFEYEHRMSEKKTVCERCGGELERLISRTSFAFKGGGWYKDLYATPKPGASSDSGGSSSSSSASSSSSSGGDKGGGDKGGSSSGGAAGGGSSGGSSTSSGGGSSVAASS
ncbi:MAG TPA: zinc ribbon domain-containing protein [Kofleriaceae bacterium]|jgi:putative FmdB family regulatory protein|nr:zinc ribbon domain-containing protein [Kofleriaceae bacterium]